MELKVRGITAIARDARAAGCEESADLIWRLVGLIDEFVNPGRFDSGECRWVDGHCEEHNYSSRCPFAVGKDLLAKRDE